MKILLIGGVPVLNGGFVQRLTERGVTVGDWWEAKAKCLSPSTTLPNWVEGVVAFKTLCSHGQLDAARLLAKQHAIPVAVCDHKWARAEAVLEATGILPPLAAQPTPPEQRLNPLPDLPVTDSPVTDSPVSEVPVGWFSTAEVAELLGVDRSRVGQLVTLGKLPKGRTASTGTRGRQQLYYPPEAVETLLSQREQRQKPAAPAAPAEAAKTHESPVQAAQTPAAGQDDARRAVTAAVQAYADWQCAELRQQLEDACRRLAEVNEEATVLRYELDNLKSRLRQLLA